MVYDVANRASGSTTVADTGAGVRAAKASSLASVVTTGGGSANAADGATAPVPIASPDAAGSSVTAISNRSICTRSPSRSAAGKPGRSGAPLCSTPLVL